MDNFPGRQRGMITTGELTRAHRRRDPPPARQLTEPRHPDEHYQRWSRWRRRHQARARKYHYQRRQQLNLRLRLQY